MALTYRAETNRIQARACAFTSATSGELVGEEQIRRWKGSRTGEHWIRAAIGSLHRPIITACRLALVTILNFHDLGDPAGVAVLAVHGITAHGLRFRRPAEQAWPPT